MVAKNELSIKLIPIKFPTIQCIIAIKNATFNLEFFTLIL